MEICIKEPILCILSSSWTQAKSSFLPGINYGKNLKKKSQKENKIVF